MDQVDKNKTAIIVFVSIILLIAIGGFFLLSRNNQKTNNEKVETYEHIKIDKSQDFIYYSDQEVISSELAIIYQKVNINIDGDAAKEVSKELNDRLSNFKQEIKKISETEMPEDQEPLYTTDDIYSAPMQDYDYYQYKNYLVLKVDNYDYDCFGKFGAHDIEYYTFNLKNGNLLTTEKLLENFAISKTELEDKLIKQATEIRDEVYNQHQENIIDLEATINNIRQGKYALTISKTGLLTANIVVFTNKINYNEDIIID